MASVPDEFRDAARALDEQGYRSVLVGTSDADLPLVLFRAPTIGQLSRYIGEASKEETGPLMAAIGLSRQVAVHPARSVMEAIENRKPLVVMRAVQALLRDLGLATRAEKKSLS